ncbi:dirigent protein 2-like [Tasmannia lanceolata]|uniref:dirigent protein 2-like n=1 Tax=Tasmannia lanceolata TaxID=3420 RepID=UPI00406287C4
MSEIRPSSAYSDGVSSDAKHPKLKETKMVFYLQDWVTGENATAIAVVGANGMNSNGLNFGTVTAINDVVTEGVDRKSNQVGRANGIYVNSALDGTDFHLLFSIVFTNKYNGSTLEIQGADRS